MNDENHNQRRVGSAETATGASRQEPFLTRWSELKANIARRPRTHENLVAQATEELAPPPLTAPTEAEEKTDADMPPIESLDANSDYKQFLSPKVSEQLRRAALRKLFHLPQYNVMDGLDTYIADCRTYAPLGGLITADMRYQMDRQGNEALAGPPEKIRAAVSADKNAAARIVKAEPETPTTGPKVSQPPVEKSDQRGTETDQGSPAARTNPASIRKASS